MRPVPLPNLTAKDVFETVSSHRKTPRTRALLAAASPSVRSAYRRYVIAAVADADKLAQLTPDSWTEDEKQALKANYELLRDSETEALTEIVDELFKDVPFCPMCGERDTTDLDHYLPRSKFAEFAVFPMNLVPVCMQCNKAKLAFYKDDSGGAIFLHAYFDDLGDQRCVSASVDTSKGFPLLTYSFDSPSQLPIDIAGRAERHFDFLGLAGFYAQKANREAMSVARSVLQSRQAKVTVSAIQDSLHRDARNAEPEMGVNSWRSAMFRALADDVPFCSGACTNVLP